MKNVLSILATLMLSGTEGYAQTKVNVQTEGGSGVRIVAEKAFDAYRNYQPLRITIENDSGRDRRWSFEFQSRGTAEGADQSSRIELAVADGAEQSFDVVVPLAPDKDRSFLSMHAVGYGIAVLGYEYPLNEPYGDLPNVSKAVSVSLGARDDVKGLVPAGLTSFTPELLPPDWRGLGSLDAIWLARAEHDALGPGVRGALDEWVLRGGRLFIVEHNARDASGPHGIGRVVSIRPGEPLHNSGTPRGPNRSISYTTWTSQHFKPIEPSSGLLTIFLLGYVVLIAPVNLFILCPSGRRTRIFWTIPSLALGASGFLTLLILLQDGIGGTGKRVTLVHLEPGINREILFQEQVSRTGALLARSFEVDATVAVYDVAPGLRHFSGELRTSGSRYAGDWFRSRSLQAQRLEAIRPSRARVEHAPGANGKVELVSSIEDPLVEIFYRDDLGRCWRGEDLSPGGRIGLEQVSENDYETWWRELAQPAGPRIREVLETLYWERGIFVARAAPEGSDVPLETLGVVDWEDLALVYTGRVESGR